MRVYTSLSLSHTLHTHTYTHMHHTSTTQRKTTTHTWKPSTFNNSFTLLLLIKFKLTNVIKRVIKASQRFFNIFIQFYSIVRP